MAAVAPWVVADDLHADRRCSDVQLPASISWAAIAQHASEVLYQLSGMRFPGLRTDTYRPHHLAGSCGCADGWWFGNFDATIGWWDRRFPEGWGCTCNASNELVLPGAPVANVVSVTVDGAPLDPSGYQLFDGRRLVRLIDPDTGSYLAWPCCQRLAVATTEVGTWEIVYEHGDTPPISGVNAAHELGVQLALVYSGDRSKLPQRTQSVVRQGVTINVAETVNLLKDGKTGFWAVDTFLAAFNPSKIPRRARVFSPDAMSGSVSSFTQP